MRQTVRSIGYSTTTVPGRADARLRRAVVLLAAWAGLALGTAACSSAAPNPAASTPGTNVNAGAGGAGGGSGLVTRNPSGQANGGAGSGGSGQKSAGSYSLAFAKCMRANGVPNFPDPDGQSGQLGPDSGIDPASAAFQSALNGPCRSLAPAGWLGSGPVSH